MAVHTSPTVRRRRHGPQPQQPPLAQGAFRRAVREAGTVGRPALARRLQARGAARTRPPAAAGHGGGGPGRRRRRLVAGGTPGPGRQRPGPGPGHPGHAPDRRGRIHSRRFQRGRAIVRAGKPAGRPPGGPCAFRHGPQYVRSGRRGPGPGHVPGRAGPRFRRPAPAPGRRLPDQAVPGGRLRRLRQGPPGTVREGCDTQTRGVPAPLERSLCAGHGQAPRTSEMNDLAKNLALWLVVAVVLMLVFQGFNGQGNASRALNYNEFIAEVKSGRVQEVVIADDGIAVQGKRRDGSTFRTATPRDDRMLDTLFENNVQIVQQEPEGRSLFWQLVMSFLPIALLIGFWIYMMRQMQQGGGKGAMSFGKSRAKLQGENEIKVTLA